MSQRRDQLRELLPRAFELVAGWEARAGTTPGHAALEPDRARLDAAWGEFAERMAGNYPFHHPRYAGQMLKPPHPVAIAAYTAAMHVNIVSYFPAGARASEIDAASARVLDAGMNAEDPVFLSTLRIDAGAFAAAHPDVEMDTDGVRVLRSVLMKPEHEPHVPWLHESVTSISTR